MEFAIFELATVHTAVRSGSLLPGLSRIEHEFSAFRMMVDSLDYEEMRRMMHLTLITMKLQTQARLKAGVVFPADKI